MIAFVFLSSASQIPTRAASLIGALNVRIPVCYEAQFLLIVANRFKQRKNDDRYVGATCLVCIHVLHTSVMCALGSE